MLIGRLTSVISPNAERGRPLGYTTYGLSLDADTSLWVRDDCPPIFLAPVSALGLTPADAH